MTAKPSSAEPMVFFFSDRQNIVMATPTIARNGENEAGLMIVMINDSPSIAFSDKSQAVAVVPRLAPMTSPAALESSMIPELTRPTASTVIAEEDCTIAVRTVPNRNAKNRCFVIFPISRSRAPPVIAVRDSLIIFMPVRNNARPPSIEATILKISSADIHILHINQLAAFAVILTLTVL